MKTLEFKIINTLHAETSANRYGVLAYIEVMKQEFSFNLNINDVDILKKLFRKNEYPEFTVYDAMTRVIKATGLTITKVTMHSNERQFIKARIDYLLNDKEASFDVECSHGLIIGLMNKAPLHITTELLTQIITQEINIIRRENNL